MKLITKLTILLVKIINFFLTTFFKPIILLVFKIYYRKLDKSKPLPVTSEPLLFIPAHELARKIRRREVGIYGLLKIKTCFYGILFF